ncbi:MAG: hypothetical protein IJB32_01635 [Clostridia bacterium]|nr:hypothetical protein [Clostridia bacterium]
MLKFLYKIFTDPLGLPIDPVWEFVILLIVGEIVHEIAYWVSPGGTLGSLIYWITKLLVFVAIWAILYGIIGVIKFVILHWLWFTIGGLALLVCAIIWIVTNNKKTQ